MANNYFDDSTFKVSNGQTAVEDDINLLTAALETSFDLVEADIGSNTVGVHESTYDHADIATNVTNIATNVTNIATNVTNIATNTADIATNVTNIATNTADIATNVTNIATNTADRHSESHIIDSHSDTTATGAELETLTNESNADSLHEHSIISDDDNDTKWECEKNSDEDILRATTGGTERVKIDSNGLSVNTISELTVDTGVTIDGAKIKDRWAKKNLRVDYNGDLGAAITDIGATLTTLVIDSATTLTANATQPSTLTFDKTRAGSFTGLYTLTLNGGLIGDMMSKWFDSSLTLAGTPKIFSVTPQMFDGVGDGSTDDTVALQAAFDFGVPLVFLPAGKYKITSDITSTSLNLTLHGVSPEASEILSYSSASIIFNGGTPENYDGDQLVIKDCAIRVSGTNNTATGVLNINISDGSGSGRQAQSALIDNFELTVIDDATDEFTLGIRLYNARNTKIKNVRIAGSNTNQTTEAGIHISGNDDPVEIFLNAVTIYWAEKAVHIIEEVEGVYIDNCAFVKVKAGVYCDYTGATDPLLVLTDSHINASHICVYISNLIRYRISGNLLFTQDGWTHSESYEAGIYNILDLAGSKLDAQVTNNTLINSISGTNYGIYFDDGAGSEHALIEGNIIRNYTKGIWLDANVTNVFIANSNRFADCTTNIDNDGTDNILEGVPYNFYATSSVKTLTGGATSEVILFTIPEGIFTEKPDSLIVNVASGTAYSAMFVIRYEYDDAATTATQFKCTVYRADGETIASDTVRFSIMAGSENP